MENKQTKGMILKKNYSVPCVKVHLMQWKGEDVIMASEMSTEGTELFERDCFSNI